MNPSNIVVEVTPVFPDNPNISIILPRYKKGFGDDAYTRQIREKFPYEMEILDYLDYPQPLSFPFVKETNFIVPNLRVPMSTSSLLDDIFQTTLIVPMLWYALPICIKDEDSLKPDFSFKAVRRDTLKYVRFLMDTCSLRTKITIVGNPGDPFLAADYLG